MADRNMVNGLYTLGATIGTGHYAVVKLARHIFTQKEVAIKVIDKFKLDDVSRAHLFQEVLCMKLVRHPNVVRLYDVIDTPEKLYLILELGDGGDMYDFIMKHANGLHESIARKYFQQICRGLQYCHQMGVCHRDLKPENLVFFEKKDVVKLTDFGFSNRFLPGAKLLTSCGSLAYSAPEILLGDPYDAPAVDIWSLGVILFMLVAGRAPFQEANDSETVMMILDCSYKLPSTVSIECQNLIHRMIVRDPEQRATLAQVMSDVWYRQDDDDADLSPVLSFQTLPINHHQVILNQMISGNVASEEIILQALQEDQYNYITATYYLLAENYSHENMLEEERAIKRPKRFTSQTTNIDIFAEHMGVFPSTSTLGKENHTTAHHVIDPSSDQVVPVLPTDDDERPLTVQQRSTTANNPNTAAQAMNMILEEDENPDSPPTDKTVITLEQLSNMSKLDKIDESYPSLVPANASVLVENPTTTSGILRAKDLRSVIETKRRHFSRSHSSSDSEDNTSNCDVNRSSHRKRAYSPSSLHESESITGNGHHRGRSYSNVDQPSVDTLSPHQHAILINNNTETTKRRSFSRTSSVISTNRLAVNSANEETPTDISGATSSIYIPERTRSLSIEQRLFNQSQMSISSRISIRYSTPRESTVFTKSEAPTVVRLLQQTPHQDTAEAIRTIIEHQRSQSFLAAQDPIKNAIIIEEDLPLPVVTLTHASTGKKCNSNNSETISNPNGKTTTTDNGRVPNGHVSPTVSTSSRSVLSTLKYSLIKHQNRKSSLEDHSRADRKSKRRNNRHRTCCNIS